MKRLFAPVFLILSVLVTLASPAFGRQPDRTPQPQIPPPASIPLPGLESSLEISTAKAAPGSSIVVKFKVQPGLPNDAWIGIIPSHVPHGSEFQNDQYDVTYQYLNGRTEGELTFNAPMQGGNYDFRLNSTDNNGVELSSASFTVEGTASPETLKPTLSLTKQTYAPGEEITVKFTAPANLALDAWIGLIPSHVPHGKESRNDQFDLSYQYINGRTKGELTFVAPNTKGNFDLRMNDTDKDTGVEIASVSFKVL